MLSRIELEALSFADLKDLVKNSGQDIPQHANGETLVELMVEFYSVRQAELAEQVDKEDDAALGLTPSAVLSPSLTPELDTSAQKTGKYDGYATKREYIEAMMKPVLCVITPQSPEFARQTSNLASVSVGNSLIPNREFAFVADGSTVTSVPRIAVNRIKELKVLLKGNPNMAKNTLKSSTQGSAFGNRFVLRELDEAEIKQYAAQKGSDQPTSAATGIGLG